MKKRVSAYNISYEVNSALRYIEDEEVLKYASNEKHHKHEDYQIIIIKTEEVKGFIGDTFGVYSAGDIIVMGKNVPHYMVLSKKRDTDGAYSEIEVLHFKQNLFPGKMNEIPELGFMHKLLMRSQRGLLFRNSRLFKKIRVLLNQMDDFSGVLKINTLYLILDTLGKSEHYHFISPEEYNPDNNIISGKSPLQRVYNYLYTNFRKEITLESIAEYAHQNATALCRTFKRETGKTIFQFLNKIRVENACKLLANTDMNISQVAYESGFTNLPHFNKQFRLFTNKTPTEYKEINQISSAAFNK